MVLCVKKIIKSKKIRVEYNKTKKRERKTTKHPRKTPKNAANYA